MSWCVLDPFLLEANNTWYSSTENALTKRLEFFIRETSHTKSYLICKIAFLVSLDLGKYWEIEKEDVLHWNWNFVELTSQKIAILKRVLMRIRKKIWGKKKSKTNRKLCVVKEMFESQHDTRGRVSMTVSVWFSIRMYFYWYTWKRLLWQTCHCVGASNKWGSQPLERF